MNSGHMLRKKLLPVPVYICILYGAWLMLRLSLPYLAFRSNVDFLHTKQAAYRLWYWRGSFYVHVFTGIFILVAGITQFNRSLLTHYKQLHRVAGYIYVAGVLLVTGPSGLVMALYANGGMPARISFIILSVLWLLSTALAFTKALKKQFISHGAWMMRSYALTLSAITLRFYTYLIAVFQLEITPRNAYILVAWLSWTLNLLVAEILIRRGHLTKLLRK